MTAFGCTVILACTGFVVPSATSSLRVLPHSLEKAAYALTTLQHASSAITRSPGAFLVANSGDSGMSPDEVTKKFGFWAGLASTLRSASKGGGVAKAKDLLRRYGGAYLLTSTSIAACTFALSYLLVSNGVDVPRLLMRFGLKVTARSEGLGTFGLAYMLHKAASPIRFPPTCLLTPIVARRLFGRKDEEDGGNDHKADGAATA
eukprot:CAMPEP_0115851336 /NCGR_PEP_ID=MMETSP0287-20121206/12429_1 /TAXON_ID=412157 /ORGANISM="Chrysochromulina rotalis, Strain UIO044" /LENGTH=203 /DNA_ID=CAMNT_0003305365 /DNA_START=51 /DNA_END=662 /DNA_ORIENTATION=-